MIRNAKIDDLEAIAHIESSCFSPAEAASVTAMEARLSVYPDRFWVLEEEGQICAFINGMLSDHATLVDDMFADASMHQRDGKWQMLFGVATAPAFQRRGYAVRLMRYVQDQCLREGRLGLVLTCKAHFVPFYASLGFIDEGISASAHGGVTWHAMRLTFAGNTVVRRAFASDLPYLAEKMGCLWHLMKHEADSQAGDAIGRQGKASFLAWDDRGTCLGFSVVSLRQVVDRGCTVQLDGIYVDPPFRRQGIGRSLVKACAGWAILQGAHELTIDCMEHDTENAAFFASLGFRKSGQQGVFVNELTKEGGGAIL